jgi:hypothetical protein
LLFPVISVTSFSFVALAAPDLAPARSLNDMVSQHLKKIYKCLKTFAMLSHFK